jgi:hypothetical protein
VKRNQQLPRHEFADRVHDIETVTTGNHEQ